MRSSEEKLKVVKCFQWLVNLAFTISFLQNQILLLVFIKFIMKFKHTFPKQPFETIPSI